MAQKKQRFILINDRVRDNAIAALRSAPEGSAVTLGPATRSLDQNAKFHAICTDIAKSHMSWAGKRRDADEWKVLLVSGHTKATAGEVEFVPGLEGEFVNIRESTAQMSVARAASLITYALAFCDTNGIHLTETIRGGFHDGANDRSAA
ncbi:recombination protein NinB [Rhizobium sp. CNPSo 3968]|uniref:recombination protein NinB n=1 Tax=Rhizobium sp. CNPSo 3968 TaxID=3021408 RepID=UPI00254C0D71|nr:recombination protein NinB [Rhizobium sp. CNPSo 3968]MDK4720090.1 recombination protein NinB [Rhizobium sp. CNPSo 3968]